MEKTIVWLVLIAIFMLISAVVTYKRRDKARTNTLLSQWGVSANPRKIDPDNLPAISSFWQLLSPDKTKQVDDLTWNDLDMDILYAHLNRAQSNAGEAVLYALLRQTDAEENILKKRDRMMRAFDAHPQERVKIQKILMKLGLDHRHNTYLYLKNPDASLPQHAFIYPLLAALPLVFLALGLLSPVFLLGIVLSFALNSFVFYKTNAIWGSQVTAIRHLAGVLYTAKKLSEKPLPDLEDLFLEMKEKSRELSAIERWNALFMMSRANDTFDVLTEYLRIAFQLDMISLIGLSRFIKAHQDTVQALYFQVGEMDALCALASVRASLPSYCLPEFAQEKKVEASNLTHPLVSNAVPNSICAKRNVLITGSNASGKSTFIKALAINAIFAQTFYTCWADQFVMPRAKVLTSMALRDQVSEGDSYFIVEIKSLRRIIKGLSNDHLTLCFIDEILRGTNTVERIASSAALLRYFEGQPVLCFAATHDIELTTLLSSYMQCHFREEMSPSGMYFSYRLMEGPSRTRNAIRLLEQLEFPQEVTGAAQSLAAGFDQTGKWRQE